MPFPPEGPIGESVTREQAVRLGTSDVPYLHGYWWGFGFSNWYAKLKKRLVTMQGVGSLPHDILILVCFLLRPPCLAPDKAVVQRAVG